MLYLIRSPNDTAGFCNCKPGLMNAPYHRKGLGPSGGTGWMFTCLRCGKGFDLAVAAQVPETLEQLANEGVPRKQRVVDGRTGEMREIMLLESADDWIQLVRPLLTGLVEGRDYVFFDGAVLPYCHGPVRFKGLSRDHDLPDLPHIAGERLKSLLWYTDYWDGKPTEAVLAEIDAEIRRAASIRGRIKRMYWKLRYWKPFRRSNS